MTVKIESNWSFEVSLDVLLHYWNLGGTNLVTRALLYDDFVGLTILGRQGAGKTTYAYNIIKAGYIKAKCIWNFRDYNVSFDKCADYIEQNYSSFCMHGYCTEPDSIDKILAPAVYVGLGDLNRLLLDIQDMAAKRRIIRAMFVDDVINKKLFFTRWRKLYIDSLRAWQLIRTVAKVVVFTGITKNVMPNEILSATTKIYAYKDLDLRRITYTVWRSQLSPRPAPVESKGRIKLDTRYSFLPTKEIEDVIPLDLQSRMFAMPEWLEKRIDERKRAVLSSLLDKRFHRTRDD
jgi:hypothetical protein